MSEKRRGLGRGIGALIPSGPAQAPGAARPIDVFFESSVRAPVPEQPASVAQAGETAPAPAEHRSPHNTEAADTSGPSGSAPDGGGLLIKDREIAAVLEDSARDVRAAGNDAQRAGDDAQRAGDEAPTTPSPAPGEASGASPDRGDDELVPVPGATFAEVPVDAISPNARQPRQVFDEEELEELAASIREVGVLQPVVVRRVSGAGEQPAYELIMGERRWRASQLAGNETVPAIIRETGDGNLLRDALLENLHRAQLNALEEAAAYQQLLDDFGCTHDELAARIARSRPQISNTLRLLKLPPLVQRRVAAGVLSAGHARALLGLADGGAMERLAQRVVAEGLSVRATEEIVALGDEPVHPEMRRRPRAGSHTEALERIAGRLTDHLDTRVKVTMGQRKGRIAIEFAGMEDLERILAALGERPADAVTPSQN